MSLSPGASRLLGDLLGLGTAMRDAGAAAARCDLADAELVDERMLGVIALRDPQGLLAREFRHFKQTLADLGERLVIGLSGRVRVLKGPSFQAYYPDALIRDHGDLDLMVDDERDFIRICARLDGAGFQPLFLWSTGTAHGLSSSAKYERRAPEGDSATALRVEVHFRSFPTTPLAPMYYWADLEPLANAPRDLVLLLAEFVYRDGRHKRFTVRDILDVVWIAEQVQAHQWPEVRALVDRYELGVPVLLLSHAWTTSLAAPLPDWLQTLSRAAAPLQWDGPYDFEEHYSWRMCRKRGMSRDQFESIYATFASVYESGGGAVRHLCDLELGYWLGVGMPVAGRLLFGENDELLGGALQFVQGATP